MTSYFLQLFKRGRYVSIRSLGADEHDEKTQKKKHEARERFAVAAIAFAFEHDKAFKKHFLRAIGAHRLDGSIEVVVEPERWGDLVLEGPQHVLVLEFKLGALLQDHQSPDARIFSVMGYGAQIRGRYGKSKKKLRYLVIGKELTRHTVQGLDCTGIAWHRFLISERQESEMETDLYDCLGILGAPAFLNRHMKKPILRDVKSAMAIYGFLAHVLAKEGFEPGDSESGSECLGLKIPKARNDKLAKAIKPDKRNLRVLGWIGYESVEQGKPPYLSVWFYPSPKAAKLLRGRLTDTLGRDAVKSEESHESVLIAQSPGDKSKDDAQRFAKVLRSAIGG